MVRLSLVLWFARGQIAEASDLLLCSCIQKASHMAGTTMGQRDSCLEKGFVCEEALALLPRRESGLAFSLYA